MTESLQSGSFSSPIITQQTALNLLADEYMIRKPYRAAAVRAGNLTRDEEAAVLAILKAFRLSVSHVAMLATSPEKA